MSPPAATRLKVATGVGVVMVAAGLALGLNGWGLTGMWAAIAVFTPISVALETYLTRQRSHSHDRGDGASGDRRDALA